MEKKETAGIFREKRIPLLYKSKVLITVLCSLFKILCNQLF